MDAGALTTWLREAGDPAGDAWELVLAAGATPEEILEILALASIIGMRTGTVGGKRYWESFTCEMQVFLHGLLAVDPELFEAYMELSLEPWTNGTLEPKVRELVYIAVDTVRTHLYRPGLDIHLKTAPALGATKEEIMAVYELAAAFGLRTISAGVAALGERGVS